MSFWIAPALIFAAYLGLVLYFCRRERAGEPRFDERQEQARGVAYKYGFFTLVVSIWLFSQFAGFFPWIGVETGGILCVDLGLTVFAMTAVRKDAYLKLRERPGRTAAILALAGAGGLCLGMFRIGKEGPLADGTLDLWAAVIAAGVSDLLVLTAFLYKHFSGRRGEEET